MECPGEKCPHIITSLRSHRHTVVCIHHKLESSLPTPRLQRGLVPMWHSPSPRSPLVTVVAAGKPVDVRRHVQRGAGRSGTRSSPRRLGIPPTAPSQTAAAPGSSSLPSPLGWTGYLWTFHAVPGSRCLRCEEAGATGAALTLTDLCDPIPVLFVRVGPD